MDAIEHWIGGKPQSGNAERYAYVTNPASGENIARVPLAGLEEVDSAVQSAHDALADWDKYPLTKRCQRISVFGRLLEKRADELARLISREQGKVSDDAWGEVQRGLESVEFATGISHLLKGESSENVSVGVDVHSVRQRLGVVVGITPFNFPAMVPLMLFPLAIACGNTFVLKPSEKDPSAALFLAELATEAGIPDGVFNVVHGDKVTVDALLSHPRVQAISFVGSTSVAKHIYMTGTKHGKRVQALGGAKNHAVVLPDADLDVVADALTAAAYGSSGQRCMAVSAVVAVDGIGDSLVAKLRERIDALTVGAASNADADMGPLVTAEHKELVRTHVDAGVEEGADLVVDGRDVAIAGLENGSFLGPCLFDRVKPEMGIYRTEIFGPVLITIRVETLADAIGLINRSPYGNGAAIFTNNGAAARSFQTAVEAGMVGINVAIPVPVAFYSFGGWNDSLFGDLHIHGPEAVMFFTRNKVVTTRWPETHHDNRNERVSLAFPTG